MNKKENRGITLVALVITIIVLIILAGVSINAVMNGGLIGNAKNARDDFNKAKQEEEATLSQLEIEEIELEFLRKGIPYKYKKGYITGVNLGTKVQDVLANFPEDEGYAIFAEDGITSKSLEERVETGNVLKNGDKKIGTIIIFGDCSGDGILDSADGSNVMMFLAHNIDATVKTIAMDVNHDGKINKDDHHILNYYGIDYKSINQNEYARDLNMLVIENEQYITNSYMEKLKKNYDIQFNEEKGCYILTNTELESTSIASFLNLLPIEAVIYRYDIEEDTEEIISRESTKASQMLKAGDAIMYDYFRLDLPIYILEPFE